MKAVTTMMIVAALQPCRLFLLALAVAASAALQQTRTAAAGGVQTAHQASADPPVWYFYVRPRACWRCWVAGAGRSIMPCCKDAAPSRHQHASATVTARRLPVSAE